MHFSVAEVQKVTANLSQTCGFAVVGHLFQFCGIVFKFAVPSSAKMAVAILPSMAIYPQRLFCCELFVIGQSK